ncbi:hypothetical protein CJ203_03965 [Corynebacterium tuscaniense]|uniref:CAAX prenyl protease 2/Lysostaphin resistance protein A-like domain-containing protein n=1 Tax=Corynebacterium tuscaniense TaxID=302449 RepID=A0A2N6T679_9CORY|nr:CPBP family intramembrane glutamic endopeptidase [Corynebacterium tuscaniense]PMC64817.1 hypothetical protein CJ203_03965 [Corynebacterium tuscaniense]
MVKKLNAQWIPAFASTRITPGMWVFATVYVAWGVRGYFIRFEPPVAAPANVFIACVGVWAFWGVIRHDARGVREVVRGPSIMLKALGLFFGALLVGSLVFSVLHGVLGLDDYVLRNDAAVGDVFSRLPAPISLLWMGVAGPLGEELFFRALLMRLFLRWWSPVWVIAASSLIFGLVHADGLTAAELVFVVPHIFAGLGFGLIAWKGGIVLSFLLHAGMNSFSLLSLLAQ